jgi:hypothetical protein
MVAVLSLAAALGGCLLGGSHRTGASMVSVNFMTHEPPAERVEVVSKRPYTEAVWVGGHWAAHGDDYAWTPGRWMRPDSGKTDWESGKWEHGDRGWYYTDGQWK